GTLGRHIERIFTMMLERPDVTPLLDLIDGGPEGAMREKLLARVVTPKRFTDLLHSESPNTRLAERLALRLRELAVAPIIDLVEDEEERRRGWASGSLG